MSIDKKKRFCELLNYKLPTSNQLIFELLESFDRRLRKLDKNVTTAALNNAHGDWYEWLIGISAWNYSTTNPGSYLLIPLPNISKLDISCLYKQDIRKIILDFREYIKSKGSVTLISSNPDFVIINPKNIDFELHQKSNEINLIKTNQIDFINNLYNNFIGKCSITTIIGYVSVKASLRPDRRLQISHEGSLVKAIHARIQNYKDIYRSHELKYYAISTKVSDTDRNALKTVATHSIALVDSEPQAAVDAVFCLNSLNEAIAIFDNILS